MTNLVRVVVGGSVAAVAATLLFVNASRALDATGHEFVRAAAPVGRAAPMLPRRARLVRLPDRDDTAPETLRFASDGKAGVPALIGACAVLWLARRRRLLAEAL